MKNIINAFLFGGILYFGNMLFPEYISVSGINALIIGVLVFFAIDYVYSIVATLITAVVAALGAGAVVLVAISIIITALIYAPLKLYLISTYVPGIYFSGIITYVLLTVAVSMFSLNVKTN